MSALRLSPLRGPAVITPILVGELFLGLLRGGPGNQIHVARHVSSGLDEKRRPIKAADLMKFPAHALVLAIDAMS
jgi:hypothetical protein